jgi:hypothetical protein
MLCNREQIAFNDNHSASKQTSLTPRHRVWQGESFVNIQDHWAGNPFGENKQNRMVDVSLSLWCTALCSDMHSET